MPAIAKDLTGLKEGMLTAIEDVGYKGGKRLWKCLCDCGKETIIPSARFGLTLSCGCIQRSSLGVSNSLRKRKPSSQSPEYKSWRSMIGRCMNPGAQNYHLYGGRGVTVCSEWQGKSGFEKFILDVGSRPKGTSLDRIDVNGNYEPSNCRWATAKEQANNRRDNPALRESQAKLLAEWRDRTWADPELKEKLLASRRKSKQK